MSTESGLETDTVSGVDASSSGGGNDHPSGTLADKASGEIHVGILEVVDHQARDELGCGSSVSATDDGMEKRSECTDLERKTESVNGGCDVGAKTQNVDVETKGNENKFPGGNGEVLTENVEETSTEKDSDKEAEEGIYDTVEHNTVCSDGVNTGDEKDREIRPHFQDSSVPRHVIEDIHLDGSEKPDTEVEDHEGEAVAGLKLNMSEDENSSHDFKKPADAKPDFNDSDLVWAKVRSHPWWPGQKFGAIDASEKAKKYFKKGTFLVTYFWDHTFAWNEPSRIKPFHQHFSEMEKQSNLADFRHAIDCALEEISRRIEFGLACPCVSEEVYDKIKTQNIINPGIREESSVREGGDGISSAAFFEPAKLVEYVKSVACIPSCGVTDKLRFVSHQAQLLAFHRWKGYPDLPEFETLNGSVESTPKVPPLEGNKDLSQVTVSVAEPNTVEQVSSKKSKTKEKNGSGQKRRCDSEDSAGRSKKEKTLSEFIAEKRLSKRNGNRSDDKSGGKQFSKKKRKFEFSESENLGKRIGMNDLPMEDPTSRDSAKNHREGDLSAGDTCKPQKPKPVFGIGASILRVASQMNSSTPTVLKPCSGSTPKMMAKNKNQEKCLSMNPEDVKDSSEEQIQPEKKNKALGIVPDRHSKDNKATDPQKVTGLDSKEQPGNENSAEDCSDHSCKEDCSEDEDASLPSALILNFADLDSVPSVEKLNKIFSRYGPLRESETEVTKKRKRAKVVFKRGEDAETAFSSAGKYSIFGPSLLSYRLKHVASKPSRDRLPNNKTKLDA